MELKAYFDKFANEYTAQNRWDYFWYRSIIESVIHEIPKKTVLRLLDLGTGSGIIPLKVSEKVPAAKIIAVDISEGMLNEAKKLPNVRFILSAIEDLDFDNDAFDVVTSSLALDHVQDKAALCNKIHS